MRINALFLADTAEVADDRLTLTNGMWDGLNANAFPASHPIKVVLVLSPSEGDVGQQLPTTVSVLDPAGGDAGRTVGHVRIGRLREQVPVVLPVTGSFDGPGRYQVSVSLGDAHGQVSFTLTGPVRSVLGTLPGLER